MRSFKNNQQETAAANSEARRGMLLALGLWILSSGCGYAMDDRYADQTDYGHADPLGGQVEYIGSDRQAGDQYEVSEEIDFK